MKLPYEFARARQMLLARATAVEASMTARRPKELCNGILEEVRYEKEF